MFFKKKIIIILIFSILIFSTLSILPYTSYICVCVVRFPDIKDHVFGEENNKFTNALNEEITLDIQPTEVQTAQLLLKVLDGNTAAANALAAVVHSRVTLDAFDTDAKFEHTFQNSLFDAPFDAKDFGIWIDPIDGTNEYIRGQLVLPDPTTQIYSSGLPTCLVLIGAFNRHTGEPIAGVMCQPFYPKPGTTVLDKQFLSRHLWGVDYPGAVYTNALECRKVNKLARSAHPQPVVTMSSSESDEVRSTAASKGILTQATSGAGYKLLTVVEGLADAYFLSKGSTYKYDTCGPQAVLKSIAKSEGKDASSSGGIFARPASSSSTAPPVPVVYHVMDNPSQKSWANSTGILATASREDYSAYSFFWECK